MRYLVHFLLFCMLTSIGSQPEDTLPSIQIQSLKPGMHRYTLSSLEHFCLCSLTALECDQVAQCNSSFFNTSEGHELCNDVITLIALLKERESISNTVIIGDVYTPILHRRKGYARCLLDKTCIHLVNNKTAQVIVIPEPFEYENGKYKRVVNEEKKQALITLYQQCGFKKDEKSTIEFMYKNLIPSM